ncbi:MAG: peptidoglycan-binding domain-containing protein, partial [Patescibacteria group bacterium]
LRGGTPGGGTPVPSAGGACTYATGITRTLSAGSTDAETGGQVTLLQKFLALDISIYPEGLITGYFGAATTKAVGRFQAKSGVITADLASATGYGVVGPLTRAALSRGCPGSSATPPPSPSTVTPGVPPTVEMHFAGA